MVYGLHRHRADHIEMVLYSGENGDPLRGQDGVGGNTPGGGGCAIRLEGRHGTRRRFSGACVLPVIGEAVFRRKWMLPVMAPPTSQLPTVNFGTMNSVCMAQSLESDFC